MASRNRFPGDYIACALAAHARAVFLPVLSRCTTAIMGLASSAEVELATVAIRATGSVFATAAFANGSAIWAWALFAIAHFIILYPLGIPPVTTLDGQTAYFITWPLIAIGYALLAWLAFWLLDLAELMPWLRLLANFLSINLGVRPSTVAVVLNTVWWILVVGGSVVPFEIFVFSIPWLAVVFAAGVPLLLWLALWAIYRFLYTTNSALFGSQAHVTRSIIFPGAVHTVVNLVLALVVVIAADTYNWAWIVAVILLGIGVIVTILYWFFAHSMWDPKLVLDRPPRTGDMTLFIVKGGESAPLVAGSSVQVLPGEGDEETVNARFRNNAFQNRNAGVSSVFDQQKIH